MTGMDQKDRSFFMWIAAIAIVIMAVPVLTGILMAGAGVIDVTDTSCSNTLAIYACRSDDGSITVINLGGEGKARLNEDMPFRIFIDSLNATDSASLRKSGSNLSITPPEGLGKEAGSSVTYAYDNEVPGMNISGHIVVIGNFKGDISETMLDIYL